MIVIGVIVLTRAGHPSRQPTAAPLATHEPVT